MFVFVVVDRDSSTRRRGVYQSPSCEVGEGMFRAPYQSPFWEVGKDGYETEYLYINQNVKFVKENVCPILNFKIKYLI